jgi:hypothetical protein
MGFLLESPVQLADSHLPHLSTPRGALQRSAWTLSALPPKADIERQDWHVCFVPKADIRIATDLFDHLVGAGEQRGRHFEAEHPCGLVN